MFIKFLLFLVILIIAIPAVMMWSFMRRVKNSLRRTGRQDGNQRASGYGYGQSGAYQGTAARKPEGKVLSDIEEDAEFEEVDDAPRQETVQRRQVEREEQITDAEFEEIP